MAITTMVIFRCFKRVSFFILKIDEKEKCDSLYNEYIKKKGGNVIDEEEKEKKYA